VVPCTPLFTLFCLIDPFLPTVMPLSEPAPRRTRIHTRKIEIQGFMRDDGLLDLDARITDLKDVDYPIASGIRRVGDPVHDLLVRVTIDPNFFIVDVEAVSDWVPYPGGCDTIGPAYRQLIGLNLVTSIEGQP
jgi:hypothetical protein